MTENKYADMTDDQIRDAILAIRTRQGNTRRAATVKGCIEAVSELRAEWNRRYGKDAKMFR